MSEMGDDLDKLLIDVRKTISDNKLFLEKLVDEAVNEDPEDEIAAPEADEELEEL